MEDNDSAQPDYAQLAAEQRRKEIPGTIGCVTVYGLMAMIGVLPVVPSPYGFILACVLTGIYIGLILLFGQGSIIEMGLFAFILLVLSCFIAVAIRGTPEDAGRKQKSENRVRTPLTGRSPRTT